MIRFFAILLLTSVFLAENTQAYLGPGIGLGAIGTIIGILLALFLAIVGFLWYPIKRLFRKRSAKKNAKTQSEVE